MIDDDARDPDDALFLRAFDRLAGPPPDVRAGWADLTARQPAPSRARRSAAVRQAPRLAVLAAAAVTATLLGYMARGGGDDPVAPAAGSSTSVATRAPSTPPSTSTARLGSSAPVATVPPVASGPGATPAATIPTSEAPGATSGSVGEPAPARAPTSSPRRAPSGAPAPVTTPAGTDASAPPATPVTAPPTAVPPRKVAVTGGVIEVPVVGGSFGVPSVVADPGWSYEIRKAERDRIEVRFQGSGQEATYRLQLRGDGSISVERR